ncbi:MAG: DUF2939 domain-containing protein [Paraburkholderia sp.]|uniref:DUF2939 domain-containing protein n=1 Tax=Paraburkholderia sp. TaxID=1926495 RepID=UPI0012177850|nr:DUF2939 domain-containing protein [Paraburkholderia sp.]TAM01496.1 MAG: DUF2939 domain-containing protein [Paraburkholderia sp.]TAM31258.1 MAG: DUF2939 domain-containing protein [Paraburkholderia sp.]
MTESLSNKRWIKPVAIVVAVALIVTAVGYSYASPYLVLHRLKAAADARDAETLNEYVDYPALRVSLKEQVGGMLKRRVEAQHSSNPLLLFGAAIGAALIGPLVDAYTTPDGVAALLNGMPPSGKPGEQPPPAPAPGNPPGESSAESSAESNGQSSAQSNAQTASADSAKNEPGHPQTTAGYRGLNEFVVTWQRSENGIRYSAVLQRHGPFAWKLGAVELSEPDQ